MTSFSSIRSLLSAPCPGGEVALRGWVYRTRSSGRIVFAVLRDSTGIIQVTIKKGNLPDDQFEAAAAASIESSVEVMGTMHQDERAPGGYEVRVSSLRVIGTALPFPITEYQSEELLLDNRHLWIRSREQTAVMKVKATLLAGAREWLEENEFVEVTPPIFTQNACEGGVTLFKLRYFDRDAFLSQSAQMYLESLIFSLERVYSITPSFRAEKSRTSRHLTEYWHMELEEAWVDNEGNMRIQEELVSAMVAKVLRERREELELLDRDPRALEAVRPPFKRVPYSKIIDLLREKGFDIDFGSDLGAAEERAITEDERTPVFVTDFPKECKAFYMKENEEDARTYKCADLLAPHGFGEVIGGSERETDLGKMLRRMEELGIPQEPYRWYLDLRRFGSVPHSGFGLGVERIVKWVCGLDHIRDAIPYPRTVARVYP
ncbi:MAG: asparagine--tRNA ligase [Methanomassiliicoccales archaeon]|nr:asparagine--tRNA ligase [Methanomassiliicoccales archaeon]